MNLKNIALAVCSFSIVLSSCAKDGSSESNKPQEEIKDVTMYVTSTDRIYDFRKLGMDYSERSNMSPSTITIDPSTRYQTMDGFGAAITGSSAFNLLRMKPEDRTKFLKETFSVEEGMGQSYIRIAIGCSDFSLSEYTLCDTPGIENFALQKEEKEYVIPILKEILAINPDIKILGSPWTPPRWMKVNNLTELKEHNSWTSGQLNPKYYQDYATYFLKWIEAMKAEGINVGAITPQNEPLNRGNSASLFMGWEEQNNFVKNALGPKLEAAGLGTKIYLFDHNYNYDDMADQKGYPTQIYKDAETSRYVTGAAFHNYGGDKKELMNVHTQYPDKELLFTETSIGTWNDGRNLDRRLIEDMTEIGLGTVNNWSKGIIVWNLMLDTDLGPNRDGGCQTCYGAVDIDVNNYKIITRNSHYYVVGHFAAVVRPGAVRIGSGGYTADGVSYAAFQNTDNSYAVVLLNSSSEVKGITLSDGTNHFKYDVPAKSTVSYLWNRK